MIRQQNKNKNQKEAVRACHKHMYRMYDQQFDALTKTLQ